jgi:hypothetical protein
LFSATTQPTEEQANILPLTAADVIANGEKVTERAEEAFGGKFVDPMQSALISGLRDALGIPVDGAKGALDALAIEAEE